MRRGNVLFLEEVRLWLDSLGLGKYADVFAENDVDFRAVPALTDDDLKELGLSLGHRRALQQAIAELDDRQSSERQSPVDPDGPANTAVEAERRQLTVMFCDLVGSTELSGAMDIEDYCELLSAYQSAVAGVIQAHGGYVARYMGDGLLVYFGYPTAHENDPERAARAGLGIVDAVLALESAEPLAVRIGIATGPVVVGDIVGKGVSEEAAVLGETPNLAARLQGAAAPNTVLLSPTTQELLRGRLETKALEPVNLKGFSRSVVPHRAVRALTLSEVNETRLEVTPLVGRDVELALLSRACYHAQSSEGQAVLLSGEPGVGKSRVLRAFQETLLGHEYTRVQWHCSSYHQTTANYPAIEQLKRSVQLPDDREGTVDELASVLDRLGLDPEKLVPPLALLLSLSLNDQYMIPAWSPDELRRRIIAAQVDLLLAAASRGPALLLVEDLHWADPSTLEVLGELIEATRDARALILMTARPEFSCPWTEQSHAMTQTLSKLSRNETAALVNTIVEGQGLRPELLALIVDRTGGIPLYIEELTKTLLESAGDAGVPASLQDLLMARLDRLGPAKELAQVASVIGRTFSAEALCAVSALQRDTVQAGLRALAEAGLAYRRRGHAEVFEFKHALVRDAAYNTLLRGRRRKLHEATARFLEQYYPELSESEPEVLAQHFTEAGAHGEAVHYWQRAGQRALQRSAHVEAVSHLSAGIQALGKLPETPENAFQELELQTTIGPSLQLLHGWASPQAEEAFGRARQLCERSGDSQLLFDTVRGLYDVSYIRANYAAARALRDCRKINA